jgi:ADP-heptose:LPS heptosyltransferase
VAEVLMSPLSTSALKDWPYYAALIDLFVRRTDHDIVVVGTTSQRLSIDRMIRGQPAVRVVNLAGRASWSDIASRIGAAGLVVANNSGIAHLAARTGAPTVCTFAASHSPEEWMPIGARTTTVMLETICSPCSVSVAANCPYGVRCLTELDPELIFNICIARMTDRHPNGGDRAAAGVAGPV